MGFFKHDIRRDETETAAGTKYRFPPWLITYSDLITLLLTFFILLMSMADLDPVRFDAASTSLKGAFGIRPTRDKRTSSSEIMQDPPVIAVPLHKTRMLHALRRRLEMQAEQLEITGQTSITQTNPETIRVRIERSLLFEHGQYALNDGSSAFLDSIAENAAHYPIDIRIEGHSAPEETLLTDEGAWNLSMARAVQVLRYLIKDGRIDIDRLSAAGYGDTRPASPASARGAKQIRSRVDLFLQADLNPGTGSATHERGNVPL